MAKTTLSLIEDVVNYRDRITDRADRDTLADVANELSRLGALVAVEWEGAADSLCTAMETRAEALARKAGDTLYADILDSVQSFLRDNALSNLRNELDSLTRDVAKSRDAFHRVCDALGSHHPTWAPDQHNADLAIQALDRLKEKLAAGDGENVTHLRVTLNQRADWLRDERNRGGDYEHLKTREDECRYIIGKLPSTKAEGRS